MADLIPPVPIETNFTGYAWIEWYRKLRDVINASALDHQSLTNLQGGSVTERYHLTSAQQQVVSGSNGAIWTPTLTNNTNITASTAYESYFIKYQDTVTCAGKVDIDPTAAGDTILELTIPIASNLTNDYHLSGTAYNRVANESAELYADPTSDHAFLRFTAVSTANNTWRFWFMYKII